MADKGETPADPAWDDLTGEQKQQLLEMASGNVTRRDVLTGAAALGTGAVVGGGASQAMSEPATASHNGGTIGTASNPMEMIHTEGLSGLDSLSTDEGFIGNGLDGSETRIPLIQKGGIAAYYDRGVFANGGWAQTCRHTDMNSPQLTSPFRVRPDADIEFEFRLSTVTQDVQLMAGFEESSGNNDESIILIAGVGTGDNIEFWTSNNNTTTSTDVTADATWTNENTVKIEWRDGSRVTLFVNGNQIAEHTTNLPNASGLIPFIESINQTGSTVRPPERVWAEPRLFDYSQHEL